MQTALGARPGDILYHVSERNADGTALRVRVNGKCRTWKRKYPGRWELPVKYGLKTCLTISSGDRPRDGKRDRRHEGKHRHQSVRWEGGGGYRRPEQWLIFDPTQTFHGILLDCCAALYIAADKADDLGLVADAEHFRTTAMLASRVDG
jgi:hypothetical protein